MTTETYAKQPMPLVEGLEAAESLHMELLHCSHAWEVAGSIRRQKAQVGDIEHVVIQEGTKLWDALDKAVGGGGSLWEQADPRYAKAKYPPRGSNKWGQLYRGIMYEGRRHEIFTATINNWGAILAIRTGPAEWSQMMVTSLWRQGLRMRNGYIRNTHGDTVRCTRENEFFRLAGIGWVEPKDRH